MGALRQTVRPEEVSHVRTPPQPPPIACGGAWSYEDWRDTVYRLPAVPCRQPLLFDVPGSRQAPSGPTYAADPLTFLAGYVDMVEVNSSFYRIPTAATVASWVGKTARQPEFFFTAKLYQGFTHEGRRDRALAAQFRQAFAPLREAGRLRALLAQFRYDAAATPAMRDLLRWLGDEFASWVHLVVEVRHASWQTDPGLEFLCGLGVSIAVLDYPVGRDSFTARRNLGAPEAYFRLHGRNTARFAHDKEAYEPYNYDYSDEWRTGAHRGSHAAPTRSLTIVINKPLPRQAPPHCASRANCSDRRCPSPPPSWRATPTSNGSR